MKKILLYTGILLVVLTLSVTIGLGAYFFKLNSELPSIKQLKDFKYKQPTILYGQDNKTIAELGSKRRYPVSLEKIPDKLEKALIAVEDSRFYEHDGIDLKGIVRAFFVNLKAGRIVEGGSTLTQQLVKVIYLTPERKLKRKVKEAILAYKIDNYLTKDKILELYLNQVYFGRGAYGVEAAARFYFGKHVSDLTLAECAMIAGLPKAPGYYAPHINPDEAKERRNHVLYRMYEEGFITEDEYNQASQTEINIIDEAPNMRRTASYFVDYVISNLEKELNINDLESRGFKVYTTLNMKFQKLAEKAVKKNLADVTNRQGYFGPIGNESDNDIDKKLEDISYITEEKNYIIAKVSEVGRYKAEIKIDNKTASIFLRDSRWAHPYKGDSNRLGDLRTIIKEGDYILVKNTGTDDEPYYELTQEPQVEGSFMVINPKTGAILTMVGGYDYGKSMFNRAVDARRQVGSLFKPVVYSAAMENGYNPMSLVFDAPIIKTMENKNEFWRPENFEKEFYGFTTLKKALTKSRNVVTIKLADQIGVSTIKNYAEKFGITSDLANNLSISIGSGAISLKEMVYAYSVFPNMGERMKPFYVTKVVNRSGEIIYEQKPVVAERTLKPETAQIMTDMLINVIENGTGRRASHIHRVMGGKTGTTDDYIDAWFVGFTPNLTIGSWTGFDDYKTIGNLETGARAALPAWIDFTEDAVKYRDYEVMPSTDNVYYYKVDKETHKITDSYSEQYSFEPFYKNPEEQKVVK
ncbi:penicillin-binding protein, 1A family [Flexistipes sinusarabici DSM 4947]|uniref:Penicillin-binding protein 1A n=4 Tax=Flexistipes sinusarabici TaxID=2352 RepID=F8E6F3_FLESM|nr:PBP1A family penicillin-binding protein [Flexistipes sinusarabici]AEI14790.1 penicillin-binding protein, 1A family [Flexistipes sinusarabici DSM 4947]